MKLVPKMIASGSNFFNPSLMPNHSYNKTPKLMTKPYEVVFNLSSPTRIKEPLQPRVENLMTENESEMKRNKSIGLTLTRSKNHSATKSRLDEEDLAQSLLISTIK